MKRPLYVLLGFLFVGIGILGAILPVLPSTCFFIIAAYYFGLSSEKLENWMLNHPRIGPSITSWRKYRAIPRLGKIMATTAMTLSGFLMIVSAAPLFVKIGAILTLVACAAYVLTRPTLEVVLAAQSRPEIK